MKNVKHFSKLSNFLIGALQQTNTWTLVTIPLGKCSIGYKWVYKIKYQANGNIDRYKALLVVYSTRTV